MGKTRKIHLDTKDINDTINILKNIQKEINSVDRELEHILDEAVAYCKEQSGNFKANTYWRRTNEGYQIVQESEGVLFVEFGTGLVGHENMHKSLEALADAQWIYGAGITQHETGNGRYGWFYPTDESRKEWKFTEGQPSRMQMYKTAQWLSNRLNVDIKMKIRRAEQKW